MYYGFLFAFFILAPKLMNPAAGGPFAESRGTQVWFWTYTTNYLSLVKDARLPLGLNHFWTLAVEEQFLKLKRFFPLPSSRGGELARLQNVDDPGGGDGRGPRWSQLELEPVVATGNEGEVENH